jgi:DNA-binding NarL/FixJ family response regulator
MPIRLAIIDDNQTLAKTLKRELMEFPEISSITLSASGLDFVSGLALATTNPDVVLMDISMGVVDEGIQATRLLHNRYPAVKVVMFTVAEDDESIFEAFKSGSVGYLIKNERPDFIYKTIVDVYNGGALMSPGIALRAIRFLTGETKSLLTHHKDEVEDFNLTDRELEVLRLLAKGYTYSSMATMLFVSPETVKKHLSNIFKKLHVKNKIEAINKTKELL